MLVRLYARVFETGGVPLEDTPLEAAHMTSLLTTLICVAPLLWAHVAMGSESAWWAVAIAFDVVAIAYAATVIVLPCDKRRTLYAATVSVAALTVLVTAWVHGPGHIVHFYAAIAVAVGHILHVPSPLLWAVHGGYLAVVVAQGSDIAWAAFGHHHPTATHVDRALLGPGFVFLWHFLGNMGVAVGVQLSIGVLTSFTSQQREGDKTSLQECEKLGKILETRDVTALEEAIKVPGSRCELAFHLKAVIRALLDFRAFLPDNYDDEKDEGDKQPVRSSPFRSFVSSYNKAANARSDDSDSSSVCSPASVRWGSFSEVFEGSRRSSRRGSKASNSNESITNSANQPNSRRNSKSTSSSSKSSVAPPAACDMETINLVVLTAEMITTEVDFLTVFVAEVKHRNGVVHSYSGGIVVATWAKSKRVPRPYVNAVRAAVNASQMLPQLRMGLDVSPCLVGTLGDPALSFFSELRGPAVEGSFALCTLCGVLDAKILMSDSIRGDVRFACLSRLVGFTTCTDVLSEEGPPTLSNAGGLRVFEILDLRSSEKDKGEASEEEWQYLNQTEDRMQGDVGRFERGVTLYSSGHTEEALEIFHEVLRANPQDRVAAAFVRGFPKGVPEKV